MNYFEDNDNLPFKPEEIEVKQDLPNRFLHSKSLIIVDEKSQALVPPKPEQGNQWVAKHIKVYLSSKCSTPDIEDYLLFAQSLIMSSMDETGSDDNGKKKNKGAFSGDGLILGGMSYCAEHINEQALNFLAQMNYNISKAKFYLLFPTLLVYNQYKHQHKLEFSDEYMNEKIEQYISKLNEDKMMQQSKWKQEVTELINQKNKVHLTQIQSFIEQGQQLKYEIPEQIKQIYQQSLQTQKQLNKILKNQEKIPLEQLRQTLDKYEDQIPVITIEIQQLRELVAKSELFHQKLSKLPIPFVGTYSENVYNQLLDTKEDKIQLKLLTNLITEYKQLPIQVQLFEQYHKKLYDYCQELINKIKGTKLQQSKTRLAQVQKEEKTEKISLQQAESISKNIQEVIVTCEDFDQFQELYHEAIQLNEKASLTIEDAEMQQRLLQEVSDCPFYLEIQERLQSMIDYSQILERIKSQVSNGDFIGAAEEIHELQNRGITNEELKSINAQVQQVLEWNQYCEQILNYCEEVSLVDVYADDFCIQQLLCVQPPLQSVLDQEKVKQMKEIQSRINEWREQLIQLLDNKRKQPKSFTKLFELFREGLQYKTELSLMNKVRQTILQIIDWYAQVHLIKSTLKLQDDCQIEQIDQLSKIFIDKNGQLTNLEQVEKLQKFQSPFIQCKDLQVIQALILHIEKWNKQARDVKESKNQNQIAQLLLEAKQLPVDEDLVKELQKIYDANQKVFWIQQIINQKDPVFKQIYDLLGSDESIQQLKQDLVSFKQIKRNKKEGPKVSQIAQEFYLKYTNTIIFYLDIFNDIEKGLKRMQLIKIQKFKDIQKDVQDEETFNQIEEWLKEYQNWLNQLSNFQDCSQSKKKKRESEYSSDHLYYFKVPELLCLVLQGIVNNYLCNEIIEAITELNEINAECKVALTVQTTKEIKHYRDVFMPQFYVMGKKFRVINNWVETAQFMITHTPRLKNLIIGAKIKVFLEHFNSIEASESKKEKKVIKQKLKIKEESIPEQESQSQQQTKSKRKKLVSKLMRDDSMAFYDANVSLKKAFGNSPVESKEQDPILQKKPNKRYKRTMNRKPNMQESEINSADFLETIKGQSQELLDLYDSDLVYCICRQGGESAINDFQIIKSLDEKNGEQFFNHHLKLQQQVKFMICCDQCEEWFHYECMGIKNKKDQQDKYICRLCLMKQNVPYLIMNELLWDECITQSHELYEDYLKHQLNLEKNILPQSGEYIYSTFDLPTVDEFKEFVALGRKLPATLLELELLEILEIRIDHWLLGTADAEQLLAESEWLPVQLPQAKNLLMQVCQQEFLSTAQEILLSKATFKTKQLKKAQMEKTEQLYNTVPKEKLTEQDQQIMRVILALKLQNEMNQQLAIQLQTLKNQFNIEPYEQLVSQFEKDLRKQQQQFTLPKLTELKFFLQRIYQWESDLKHQFKDNESLMTDNLNQDYYDCKPTLNEAQQRLKEYETMVLKLPSKWVEFMLQLVSKANEYIQIIELSLHNRTQDEQFELAQNVYKLKCKIPQFKEMLNNVPKEVQLRLIQWLPFIKFN